MKKIFIPLAALLYGSSSCNNGNAYTTISTLATAQGKAVPTSILTTGEKYWQLKKDMLFGDDKQQATDTLLPGCIARYRFEPDGRFRFLYEDLEVSGRVDFEKNEAGRNILHTHAQSATCKPGSKIAAAMDSIELRFSKNYLWEKVCIPGMPGKDMLLLVDIDTHPGAAKGGPVNPQWVEGYELQQ